MTKKGKSKKILELYYVHGLKHNLISVDKLMQKGYKVNFQGQECVIYDRPPRK